MLKPYETLRLAGLTVREIAERVGCSFQYAHQVVRKMSAPEVRVSVQNTSVVVESNDMPVDVLASRVGHALERLDRRT